MTRKYTITLTEEQIRIVNTALDLYSRLGTGQLEIIDEFLRHKFWPSYSHYEERSAKISAMSIRSILDHIKSVIFGHPANVSWGIRSENVPADCREAYDIYQITRKAVCRARVKQLEEDRLEREARWVTMSVGMDSYWPTNPDLPPVECSQVPDEVPDEVPDG